MEYVNQHFVTEAYLRAWCDPSTPNGAFVWVASKDGGSIRRKSPRSLFAAADFYTTYDLDGNRVLDLEHKLKQIEDRFVGLRDTKLRNHEPLGESDRMTLALFAATAFARTKREKQGGQQIWRDYLDMVDELPPELSQAVKKTQEYQDVLRLHKDQPLLYHLYLFVNTAGRYLYYLNCAIYETNLKPGLITSDNPCIWFDPSVYDLTQPLTYFGVGSPTLNIIFPISPWQYASFEQRGPDGYKDLSSMPEIEEGIVDSINAMTVANSAEQIVVSEKALKPSWFQSPRT